MPMARATVPADAVSWGAPAWYEPYAERLYARYPELLVGLGHPSVADYFNIPTCGHSCTEVKECIDGSQILTVSLRRRQWTNDTAPAALATPTESTLPYPAEISCPGVAPTVSASCPPAASCPDVVDSIEALSRELAVLASLSASQGTLEPTRNVVSAPLQCDVATAPCQVDSASAPQRHSIATPTRLPSPPPELPPPVAAPVQQRRISCVSSSPSGSEVFVPLPQRRISGGSSSPSGSEVFVPLPQRRISGGSSSPSGSDDGRAAKVAEQPLSRLQDAFRGGSKKKTSKSSPTIGLMIPTIHELQEINMDQMEADRHSGSRGSDDSDSIATFGKFSDNESSTHSDQGICRGGGARLCNGGLRGSDARGAVHQKPVGQPPSTSRSNFLSPSWLPEGDEEAEIIKLRRARRGSDSSQGGMTSAPVSSFMQGRRHSIAGTQDARKAAEAATAASKACMIEEAAMEMPLDCTKSVEMSRCLRPRKSAHWSPCTSSKGSPSASPKGTGGDFSSLKARRGLSLTLGRSVKEEPPSLPGRICSTGSLQLSGSWRAGIFDEDQPRRLASKKGSMTPFASPENSQPLVQLLPKIPSRNGTIEHPKAPPSQRPFPGAFPNRRTVFFFDWDDTLCPTTWIRSHLLGQMAEMRKWAEEAQSPRNDVDWQDTIPPWFYHRLPDDPKVHECIERLQRAVINVITVAQAFGVVVIVTNACAGWIEKTIKKWLPELAPYVHGHGRIPAIRILYGQKVYKRPGGAAATLPWVDDLGEHMWWKKSAMSIALDEVDVLYRLTDAGNSMRLDTPHSWCRSGCMKRVTSVVSIGDNEAEMQAVKLACLDQRRGRGPRKEAGTSRIITANDRPMRAGSHKGYAATDPTSSKFSPLVKRVKFRDLPNARQLTVELEETAALIPRIVAAKEHFRIDMDPPEDETLSPRCGEQLNDYLPSMTEADLLAEIGRLTQIA